MLGALLKTHENDTFCEFIAHDYLEGLEKLLQLGMLDRNNFSDVMERASKKPIRTQHTIWWSCVSSNWAELRCEQLGRVALLDYDI